MCVNALVFDGSEVWIPKKMVGSMRRLREGEGTREEMERKIIAAFWRRLSDYSTLPYFTYWGNLIDGLRWTENAHEAGKSKDCIEMMPIIGRDDLDAWIKMVRIGTDLEIKFKTSGVKARMAEIMLEEGIVRYLRQGGTACDRVEEFCETLIEGGVLEPGWFWKQAVKNPKWPNLQSEMKTGCRITHYICGTCPKTGTRNNRRISLKTASTMHYSAMEGRRGDWCFWKVCTVRCQGCFERRQSGPDLGRWPKASADAWGKH